MSAPTKRILAGLAALAIILALIFWPRHRGSPKAKHAKPAESDRPVAERSPDSDEPMQRVAPVQHAIPTVPGEQADAPIIDSVEVEKKVVCRGEENLVTVHAHMPNPADDVFLHYYVVMDNGASVPLRIGPADGPNDLKREITAFGRNNVATKTELPFFQVKDCEVPRMLQLNASLLVNTDSGFRISARIINRGATDKMEPQSYHWEFGDGSAPEDTAEPFVTHDFGARPQDTLFSQILISCTATTAKGERLLGRMSMQLLNAAFEELAVKKLVRLFSRMEPRFPVLGSDGTVVEQIHVWHLRQDAVRLTKVHLIKRVRTQGAAPIEQTQDVDPSSITGTTMVPHEGIDFRVTLDTRRDPDLLGIEYFLEGVSADGMTAQGNFSLMRPPDLPTKEDSQPVLSEYMKARILRARELLHKPYVTDEDIWQLDREGKMQDIRAENYPKPAPAPEPVGLRPPSKNTPPVQSEPLPK